METYILRTHLIDTPEVFFYYKGRAREKGVPFALNAIVGFNELDALTFNRQTAIELCSKLNLDKSSLLQQGYSEFEVISL